MSTKAETSNDFTAGSTELLSKPTVPDRSATVEHTHPAAIIQRVGVEPRSLTSRDVLQLQRTIGNRAVQRLLLAQMMNVEGDAPATDVAGAGHDFSRPAVHTDVPVKAQAKLTVNTPGDRYEQEADRAAEQVMRTPEPQLQRADDNAGQSAATPGVHEVLRSPGQPLDQDTRAFMEPRFGHDFSRVRVHSEDANSAAALNARAYTLGSDIVFGAGEYAPQTRQGRSLLAHELAHVVQQGGTPAAIQGKPRVDSPSASAEQAADAAAHTVMNSRIPSDSAASRTREQLQTTALSGPVISRAVTTWGGEFDTDKYELTSDPGQDGVEIELRFKPGANVNAESIATTQTARSTEKGAPVIIGTGASKQALEQRTIPAGEAGAGTKVDRLSSRRIPLYGTDDPAIGDSLTSGTVTSTTQRGWRYTDAAGTLQKQDALLKDRSQLFSTRKESGQVFETTALAIKGAQEGTFYGSVQWGWTKDASDKITKLPLTLVSQGVPSATFNKAAGLWNKGKTSEGKETIDLPVVSVKVITGAGAQLFATPNDAQAVMVPGTPLPIGTRFRILRDVQYVWVHPVVQVEIVDGPLTGQPGYILSTVAYSDE
jgi:hypothetical protein